MLEQFPELIDMTNDCGETAAACATEMGNVEILKVLLKNGTKLTSDRTDRVNILDSAFGYFRKAEETIMEIVNFCDDEDSPKKLEKGRINVICRTTHMTQLRLQDTLQ